MPAEKSQSGACREQPLSTGSDQGRVLELEERLLQMRKVLHRMNNDLTAVSLSVESLILSDRIEGGVSDSDRCELVKTLLSQLTADFRNLTLICRGGSAD